MIFSPPDAADQAHPCRPTVSCTADIVSPGRLEVESGVLYASATGGGSHALSFPLLLKQTVLSWLQLQVGSNGYTLVDATPSAHYFDNVYFGPKLHLRDQSDVWPSLAVSAQASLPVFRAAGYDRNDDVFLTAFASKDIAFLHLDWNVGALFWRVDSSPATSQAFTALAVSPIVPSRFGAALEGYYFTDASPVAARDGGIRLAVSYAARSWLVIDAGGDAGFFPSTRAYSLFCGITVLPVVILRPD